MNKKKIALIFSFCSVIALVIFFAVTDATQNQGEALTVHQWKKNLEKVSPKATKSISVVNKRSIASVENKKNKKTDQNNKRKVLPYKKFIEQKRKNKLIPDSAVRYRSLAPGKKSDFKNSNSSYKFLDHFYALKDTAANREKYPEATYKLNYLIVKSQAPIVDALPVVENEHTGRFGVFTGIIKTKLKDMHLMESIIEHPYFEIIQIYDHINLVQYKIDDVALAIETKNKLENHPNVIRSRLEILEYSRDQK